MDNDGNKITWSVIIIAAVASIGLMFVNFMPSQTANIKAAIGNELSSFINSNKSDSSSNSSSSSHTDVGTNLLKGTSSSEQSYIGDFSTVPGWSWTNPKPIAVNAGSTYTYSIYLTKLTGSFVLGYWTYNSDKTYTGWYPSRYDNRVGKVSWTFTTPSNASYISPHIVHVSNDFACTAKEEKLEKGSVATPWCPNPADHIVSD